MLFPCCRESTIIILLMSINLIQLASSGIQNESSSQVPKNHRLYDSDIQTDPLDLSQVYSSRFDGYRTSNDFLSDNHLHRQQAGPMFLPVSFQQQQKDSTPANNKWSIAYNQQQEEEDASLGGLNMVSPPVVGITAPNQSSQVMFDDEENEPTIYQDSYDSYGNTTTAPPNEASSNLNEHSLSLGEARKALDESLTMQGKLVSLLARSKIAATTTTTSTTTTPKPNVIAKFTGRPMALMRQSTQLMSGLLPPMNSVQHPAARRAAAPGPYQSGRQRAPLRQKRPLYSRPLVEGSSPIQTLQESSGDSGTADDETIYPSAVSEPPNADHQAYAPPSAKLGGFKTRAREQSQARQQTAATATSGEEEWQRFYRQQRPVNPVTMGSVFAAPIESGALEEQAAKAKTDLDYADLARGPYAPPSGSEQIWATNNDLDNLLLGQRKQQQANYRRRHHYEQVALRPPRQQHPAHQMASSRWLDGSGGGDDVVGGVAASRPRHQVVHVLGHQHYEKKSHGKYLWPIVGGGLTMLMGFLIISNILLSIPLLALGASSLLNNNQLGLPVSQSSQQLVPVYNLSSLISTGGGSRTPAGRRRRRHAPAAGASRSSAVAGAARAELEARLERLVAGLVPAQVELSRLLGGGGGGGKWAGGGWRRLWRSWRQVLKAAYCHPRPIKIKQPFVSAR